MGKTTTNEEPEYRPHGEAKLNEISNFQQYDAEEKRRIERRDYERGRAEKRKKQKVVNAEREKEAEAEKERQKWADRPIPKSFVEAVVPPEHSKENSEVVYAKKFCKHGKCVNTAEAVAKFRKVCNESVFAEKRPAVNFIDEADQEALLLQIKKIHRKLGFCPVTLI